jgi:hypothetical protein
MNTANWFFLAAFAAAMISLALICFGKRFFSRSKANSKGLAKAALSELLFKQCQDLESYGARAPLFLIMLQKARACGDDAGKLISAKAMVQAFLSSAEMFKSKWADQLSELKEQYPVLKNHPEGFELMPFENVPKQLAVSEDLIKQALQKC